MCQYYIVFAPKYRRKEVYGTIKKDIEKILKYKYGSRHWGCRGYYVDTVRKNKKIIEEHIKNQLEKDCTLDQMSISEYTNPFTGN